MKNKHPNAIVVLALGFAYGGAAPGRPVALVRTPKPAFCHGRLGLAAVHPLGWRRWCCPYLPAAAAKPADWFAGQSCPPLGMRMVPTGAALVAAGFFRWQKPRRSTSKMFSAGYPGGRLSGFFAAGFVRRRLLYYGGRAFSGLACGQTAVARCWPAKSRFIFEIDLVPFSSPPRVGPSVMPGHPGCFEAPQPPCCWPWC